MNYLIYKITNRLNNKIYVGAHKTENKNDTYFGSGLLLERAIQKYGEKNFNKEILFECSSEEEMWQKEADIVDEEFISRDDTYNIKLGGCGGFDHINKNKLNHSGNWKDSMRKRSAKAAKKRQWLWQNDPEYREEMRKKLSTIQLIYQSTMGNPFAGRKHTDESKRKIGEANSKKMKGKNNPSYGKHWITDGTVNKLFDKNQTIPPNFRKGRV